VPFATLLRLVSNGRSSKTPQGGRTMNLSATVKEAVADAEVEIS
jgi:hypothetical protein